jgi:hypothetical protein
MTGWGANGLSTFQMFFTSGRTISVGVPRSGMARLFFLGGDDRIMVALATMRGTDR